MTKNFFIQNNSIKNKFICGFDHYEMNLLSFFILFYLKMKALYNFFLKRIFSKTIKKIYKIFCNVNQIEINKFEILC